jgi:hypothetical protein
MSTRRVVQFLHPGDEHRPDRWIDDTRGWKGWNCRGHKRKFLLATGWWTSKPKQEPTSSAFTFWGEWEPQSQVRRLVAKNNSDGPQWLHIPRLNLDELTNLAKRTRLSCSTRAAQNTDPLVFGDRFRYVLCQQYRKSGPTKLAYLDKGDIILFGSHISGHFALDTVFVIGVYALIHYDGALPDWESDLHRRITIDLIEIPAWGLRLYGSDTWSGDKPFSFVPCLPTQTAPRGFKRPVLTPSGSLCSVISPELKQGFKIAELDEADARAAWGAVVRQVVNQGCALATAVDEPNWRPTRV